MVGNPEREEMVFSVYSAITACKCGVSRKAEIARQAVSAIIPKVSGWHRASVQLNSLAFRIATALGKDGVREGRVVDSPDRLMDELLWEVRNRAARERRIEELEQQIKRLERR